MQALTDRRDPYQVQHRQHQRPIKHWTAAVVERGDEWHAAYHIEKHGFDFYLPQILIQDSHGRYDRRHFLMPGYILVKLHIGWEQLLHLRGIRRFMLIDKWPLVVRDHEIDYIRSLEDNRGFVYLGQRVFVGNRVRVRVGIYGGRRGRVDRMQIGDKGEIRCRVLLRFMRYDARKWFEERALERV